jgi:hypothetical protein
VVTPISPLLQPFCEKSGLGLAAVRATTILYNLLRNVYFDYADAILLDTDGSGVHN